MEDIRQAQHFGTKTSSKGRNAIYVQNTYTIYINVTQMIVGKQWVKSWSMYK